MIEEQPTYICYTLFDIKDRGNRSETRNWNTLIQVLSLRTQPFITKFPECIEDDLKNYQFGELYTGMGKIWTFEFQVEHDLFRRGNNPIANLIDDTELVPLLDKHDIIHPPCCLLTSGPACNIYYVYNSA